MSTTEIPDPTPLRSYFDALRLIAAYGPMSHATRAQAIEACDGNEADVEEFLAFDAEQDHEADHRHLLARIAYFDWLETTARNTVLVSAISERVTDALISIANVRTDRLDSDARDQDWRLVARKMESIARTALGWPT